MTQREYYRPGRIEEALQLLDSTGAKLLAGGTDLIIAMRERKIMPQALLDLSGIHALGHIENRGGALYIGAMATFSQIAANPLVQSICPMLAEAALKVGAPQIRNRATIGGNVANAATAADSVPALLAADALAEIACVNGRRTIPVCEVVTGLNKNSLAKNEMILGFVVKERAGRMAFEKIGRRRALAISRINLAAALDVRDGCIRDVAVAVGAVGKTAYRVKAVEALLEGRALTRETVAEACALMDETVAINLAGRSTTPYKRKIAAAVLERALTRIGGEELA